MCVSINSSHDHWTIVCFITKRKLSQNGITISTKYPSLPYYSTIHMASIHFAFVFLSFSLSSHFLLCVCVRITFLYDVVIKSTMFHTSIVVRFCFFLFYFVVVQTLTNWLVMRIDLLYNVLLCDDLLFVFKILLFWCWRLKCPLGGLDYFFYGLEFGLCWNRGTR